MKKTPELKNLVFDNILDLPRNNEIYSYFDDYFIKDDEY